MVILLSPNVIKIFFISIFLIFYMYIFIVHLLYITLVLHTHSIPTKTDDMTDSESPINLLLFRFPLSAFNNYTYGHFLLFYGSLLFHNLIKHISTCRNKNVGNLDTFFDAFDFSPFIFASIWHCIGFLLFKVGAFLVYILSDFIKCSRIFLMFLICFFEKCRIFTFSLFFTTRSIFALSNKVLRLIELFSKYLSCSKQKSFVTSYILCNKTLIFVVLLVCFDYFLLTLLPKGVENLNMSISSVGTSFQGFDDLWGANVYGFSFRFIYFTISVNLKAIFILHMIISIYNPEIIETS